MQRTPLIAANWKMNGSAALVEEITRELTGLELSDTEVLICPPATLINRFSAERNFALGAQNVNH